jgi:hypothetical protein
MEKGRVEFEDPTFRLNSKKSDTPLHDFIEAGGGKIFVNQAEENARLVAKLAKVREYAEFIAKPAQHEDDEFYEGMERAYQAAGKRLLEILDGSEGPPSKPKCPAFCDCNDCR